MKSSTPNAQPAAGEYRVLPLASIQPSPLNPRKRFDQADLEELAASIRSHGIQQPLVVRSKGGAFNYELVCGERRFRAAQIAGLGEVPTIVRTLSDADALEIMIVENNQRSDVHPLEEAAGFAALLETKLYGEKREAVKKLAGKVGKSPRYVYDSLKLYSDLAEPVREAFLDGKLAKSHAVPISRLNHEDQAECLKELEDYEFQMSSRALAEWIAQSFTLKLSAAPWHLGDEKLLPMAGACLLCTKNTSNDGLLMPDLEGAANGLCTDRECYEAKRRAFLDQKIAEAREKSGTDPVLIKRYGDSSPGLNIYEVETVAPDAPGAVPAVCTTDLSYSSLKASIGDVVYIKDPAAADAERAAKDAEWKRKRELEERPVLIEKEFRQKLFKELAAKITVDHGSLATLAVAIIDRSVCESQLETIKALLPFQKPKGGKLIAALTEYAQTNPAGALFIAAFISHLSPWKAEPLPPLEALADAHGFDVPNFRMEIAAKHLPPSEVQTPADPEPEAEVQAAPARDLETDQAPASEEALPDAETPAVPESVLQLGSLWVGRGTNSTFLVTRLTKHKVWADCWDENGDQRNGIECTRENFLLFRRPATPEEIAGFQSILAPEESAPEPEPAPIRVEPYTWWRADTDLVEQMAWVTATGDLIKVNQYVNGKDLGVATFDPDVFVQSFRPATVEEFEGLAVRFAALKAEAEKSAEAVQAEELPKVSDITGEVAPIFTILRAQFRAVWRQMDADALADLAAVNSLSTIMANPPSVLGLVDYLGRRWVVVDINETQAKLIPAVPREEFTGVVRKAGEAGIVGQVFEFEGASYVAGALKDRVILEVKP